MSANIANGKQGAQSRWTGYEADELIAHIKQSAASGQSVDITWKQARPPHLSHVHAEGLKALVANEEQVARTLSHQVEMQTPGGQ